MLKAAIRLRKALFLAATGGGAFFAGGAGLGDSDCGGRASWAFALDAERGDMGDMGNGVVLAAWGTSMGGGCGLGGSGS